MKMLQMPFLILNESKMCDIFSILHWIKAIGGFFCFFSFNNLSIDILGLKSLEAGYLNKLCKSVKLLVGVLILVTLSRETDANACRYVTYSAAPYELVELSINTDVLGSHSFHSKLLDLLDSTRCLFLEGGLVGVLREVDGVIARYEIRLGLAFFGHDKKC